MPVWCCRCSLAGHFRSYNGPETEGQLLDSFVQYFGDSLGRKVKRMPLIEETVLPGDSLLTLPVVIIGNGPSGICLSYLLSGYRPYLSPEAIHPNPVLHTKLEEARHLSIVDQSMEGSMRTISFGDWMELPGLTFKEWAASKRRNIKSDRVMPEEIACYYKHYVKVMGLQKNFRDNVYITSVSRLYRGKGEDDRSQLNEGISTQHLEMEDGQKSLIKRNWEVRGYQRAADGSHVPFCLFAENVALATGTFDSPGRLQVEGEDFPFVLHSMSDFGAAISKGKLRGKADPVLIVGAGLTAADAVLCACSNNIPVIHVFRRRVTDTNLIFKQLPKKLYPEYHKVYHMMCTQSHTVDSPLHSAYTSFPEHNVLSFKPEMKCVLQSASGLKKILKFSVALVLIGSHPNLFFLKDQGYSIGHHSNQPITCKGNPIEIDPYTYECTKEANLFALGPLVGDNFVRFLKGGALGITRCLAVRQKKKHELIESGDGRGDGVP
ncbi:oxidative stress-induced growth inhibitor 2 isoform X3 [Apus apus]|uniref:oxidative stress-induced growth inhibitor 2 isoform X3 n=1 Tax=Apus apus TaxID=8895 RepID=UPI0021F85343|nr:oxidative stress-induced growth inhibitor 2 isoform X3 [Apus apus]